MQNQPGSCNRFFLLGWIFLIALSPALAIDPPDSTINPVSGVIEVADAALQGGNYNIRHTEQPGNGDPLIVQVVTSNPSDDLGARLANAANGDTYVVWWRDGATKEVWLRKRTQSTSSWGDEVQVSEAGTDSRRPEIAHNGSEIWVALETDAGLDGLGITVQGISDDPVPVLLLATTLFTGDLDLKILSVSSELWISWVNDDCEVGWSEYDSTSETWSVADYESCDSDSVEDARSRIRTKVLGS